MIGWSKIIMQLNMNESRKDMAPMNKGIMSMNDLIDYMPGYEWVNFIEYNGYEKEFDFF